MTVSAVSSSSSSDYDSNLSYQITLLENEEIAKLKDCDLTAVGVWLWERLKNPNSQRNPDTSDLFHTALVNNRKNRYVTRLPREDTLVKLTAPTDYINANWIQVGKDRPFIITQAPLKGDADHDDTFADFFEMAYRHLEDGQTIVCLAMPGTLSADPYWLKSNGQEPEVDEIFLKQVFARLVTNDPW